MKIIITISTEFSFKGEIISPKYSFDLLHYLKSHQSLEHLHSLLARENNIDEYSYAYEVMLSSPIEFSDESNRLNNYIDGYSHSERSNLEQSNSEHYKYEHGFDHRSYIDDLMQEQFLIEIQSKFKSNIKMTHLDKQLNDDKALGEALLIAYNMGKEQY